MTTAKQPKQTDLRFAAIEDQTRQYAARRQRLAKVLEAMETEMQAIRDRHVAEVRSLTVSAAAAREELVALLVDAPDLFDRPRAVVIDDVKVGYRKQRGSVTFADQARTLRHIKDKLPANQAAMLIRKTEAVHKPAVYDLTAADLKRLGITVEADSDEPVVQAVDAVGRMVEKMIAAYTSEGAA